MIGPLAHALTLACAVLGATLTQVSTPTLDPEALYRHREDLADAARAADAWATRAGQDYDAAWKLARVCYWLGTHLPDAHARRAALDRGVSAGKNATRLAAGRPEGHFWLAANMGELAESSGVMQGLKYRGAIRDELQRSLRIDPSWEGGAAEAALGQWYFEVPRLLGGSATKAEEHLRRALSYDPLNLVALSVLADVLASQGRRDDARALLRRLIEAPVSDEWGPEDREYKRKAAARLRELGGG